MRMLPAWKLPHRFWIYPYENDAARPWAKTNMPEPRHVTRSGLMIGDLLILTAEARKTMVTSPRVRTFIGIDTLVQLDDEVLREAVPRIDQTATVSEAHRQWKTPLSAFLHDACGIAPGSESANQLFGEPLPDEMPHPLIEDFARWAGPALHEWVKNTTALANEVLLAAQEGRTPKPDPDVVDHTQTMLDMAQLKLVRARNNAWAILPTNLQGRVLLELTQLWGERPKLRCCRLCGRPFVPDRQSSTRCGVGVWTTGTDDVRYACRPVAEVTTEADRETRRREQTRLLVRKTRAKERSGIRSDEYRAATLAYEEWRKQNPRPERNARLPKPADM